MNRTTIRAMAVCVALIASFAVGPSAMAQGREGADPQRRVDRELDRLTRELALTDEQRQRLEPVLLDSARRVQAAFDARGDRNAMRSTMRKIGQETEKKVGKILDDRQMKRYREIVAERRQSKRKGGRPPR